MTFDHILTSYETKHSVISKLCQLGDKQMKIAEFEPDNLPISL